MLLYVDITDFEVLSYYSYVIAWQSVDAECTLGSAPTSEEECDDGTKETFNAEESETLLRGFLSKSLFEAGPHCRADDRGDPVVRPAPPLVCGTKEFDEIESMLRSVLTEAWTRL